MKDLKHLIYFENLLQEANNDLVQQARTVKRRLLILAIIFLKFCLILITAFPSGFARREQAQWI